MQIENGSKIAADLTGKVILITGASYGLGAYYAKLLAKNQATVIVSGREHSLAKLNEVVNAIHQQGGSASLLVLDMSDYHSFNDKVSEITAEFGKIDVLINNAAVGVGKNLFDITEENWDVQMNTNVKGLFFLSQAVARRMKEQRHGGNIINITAVNAERVRKNNLVYGASKAAVNHLTRLMAYELINDNIRVNALSLGLFESEPVKDFLENDADAQKYLERIPSKRAGQLSDLDGPMLLLASDASSYMFGSILNVDGGFAIDVFMNTEI